MAEHNHMTRDIKPLWGGCRGCDEYHVNALQMRVAELRDQIDAANAKVAELDEVNEGLERLAVTHATLAGNLAKERDAARADFEGAWDELDRARAEVAVLRERLEAAVAAVAAEVVRERDDLRAEVEAKDRVIAQAYADRDAAIADAAKWEMALADLRVKVEGLHDSQHFPWLPKRRTIDCGCAIGRVLALFEEAERG